MTPVFTFQMSTAEQISTALSIATPVILLLWFYYSRRLALSKSYFTQIEGLYAGFTETVTKLSDSKRVYSGIIMNILDADEKGYFRGEFEFTERKIEAVDNMVSSSIVYEGLYSFWGKIDFKLYRSKCRNPLRPDENRIYKGKFYIVERLDFDFKIHKLETYLRAEYDIVHYREMQTIEFQQKIDHRPQSPGAPKTYTLFRKMGANFEPYNNVKRVVFAGDSRVDR